MNNNKQTTQTQVQVNKQTATVHHVDVPALPGGHGRCALCALRPKVARSSAPQLGPAIWRRSP